MWVTVVGVSDQLGNVSGHGLWLSGVADPVVLKMASLLILWWFDFLSVTTVAAVGSR